jgi:formate/nitrite transporter FocA (FNT family)
MTLMRFRTSGETALSSETRLLKSGQFCSGAASPLFWSGVIGGGMIALVDWTVTASQWTIGQLAMIYLLTFVVGIGRFAHCGAGSREVGSVVIAGTLPLSAYFHWISPVIWGNICGGVFIVSLLNYGQAKEL